MVALGCLGALFSMGDGGSTRQLDVPEKPLATALIELQIEAPPARCGSVDAGPCDPAGAGRGGAARRGVAGANVRAFQQRDERYLLWTETSADAFGHARIEAPPGVMWLLIDGPGRARRSERVLVAGALESLRVELPEAEPLVVHVDDVAGRPIPDSIVLVDDGDALPHAERTDSLGLAHFAAVGPHLESVRADAPGYDSNTVRPATRDVRVILSAPATLDVTVVDVSNRPAANAEVWLAGIDFWPPRRVTTGADGKAKLSGLSRGIYDVRAIRGNDVSPASNGVTLARGENAELTLELGPGRQVTAIVSDGAEKSAAPVEGAEVVICEEGLSPFPLEARTNSVGEATLGPLSPRPAVLSVRAEGFMPESGVPVPRDGESVSVALVRGGRVSGQVVDPDGVPVAGASLEVVGDDLRGRPIARRSATLGLSGGQGSLGASSSLVPVGELGVMPGPLPMPGMPPLAPPPGPGWVSDMQGRFELADIPPGRIRLLGRHPDFVETSSAIATLDPGGEVRFQLSLSRGAVLEGRLVDEDGHPVSRARIEAVSAGAGQPQAVSTQPDGYFAFGALSRDVELRIARPGDLFRFVARHTLVLGAGERREIQLVLPAERPTVVVTVLGDDGRRIAGAVVASASLEPEVPLRQLDRTDQDGEARLEDSGGLHLDLRVQATGWRPFHGDIDAAPSRIELALERGMSVVGRITQVRGRQGLSGARVMLLQDGERQSARSGVDGQFQFDNVSAGAAHLTVSHPDFSTEERDVVLTPTGRVERAFELEAIDLEESGSVAGTVLAEEGEPVAGARVGLGIVPAFLPAGGPMPPGLVETDREGRFVLDGVRVGTVSVSAYAGGVGRGSVGAVAVRPRQTTEGVEIRLSGASESLDVGAGGNVAITLGEREGELEAALDVVVVNVAAGSEAERAGISRGDIVRAVDDSPVTNMAEARRALGGSAGSEVILELERDGELLSLRVRRELIRR
jgi:hypothetical protein